MKELHSGFEINCLQAKGTALKKKKALKINTMLENKSQLYSLRACLERMKCNTFIVSWHLSLSTSYLIHFWLVSTVKWR